MHFSMIFYSDFKRNIGTIDIGQVGRAKGYDYL